MTDDEKIIETESVDGNRTEETTGNSKFQTIISQIFSLPVPVLAVTALLLLASTAGTVLYADEISRWIKGEPIIAADDRAIDMYDRIAGMHLKNKEFANMDKKQRAKVLNETEQFVIDSFYAEEPDIKLTRSSLEIFYDDLVTMDETWGSNKETLQFLDAYHREISELLAIRFEFLERLVPKSYQQVTTMS